jgi:hypothetical protein
MRDDLRMLKIRSSRKEYAMAYIKLNGAAKCEAACETAAFRKLVKASGPLDLENPNYLLMLDYCHVAGTCAYATVIEAEAAKAWILAHAELFGDNLDVVVVDADCPAHAKYIDEQFEWADGEL